jgi:hypothetical protein
MSDFVLTTDEEFEKHEKTLQVYKSKQTFNPIPCFVISKLTTVKNELMKDDFMELRDYDYD